MVNPCRNLKQYLVCRKFLVNAITFIAANCHPTESQKSGCGVRGRGVGTQLSVSCDLKEQSRGW